MNTHFNTLSRFTPDVELVFERKLRLGNRLCKDWRQISFPKYAPWNVSGVDGIGSGDVYNTPLSKDQLLMALALVPHPVVEKIIGHSPQMSCTKSNSEEGLKSLQKLIDHQVLAGIRALDLGCGLTPVFAQTMRALGAQVWTVDVVAAEDFRSFCENCDPSFEKLEQQNHIQLNFQTPDAAANILVRTAGQNFHYVSCAHPMLMDGWSDYVAPPSKLWRELLEEGGAYFDATPYSPNHGLSFKVPALVGA